MKQLILTLLLILGSTAVIAEIKAGEILGTGKVINQFDQPSKRNGKLILIHKIYKNKTITIPHARVKSEYLHKVWCGNVPRDSPMYKQALKK